MTIEDGLRVFARNVLRDKFRVGKVAEADAAELSVLMDPWQAGEAVPAGAIRAHNGTVYVCVQAHTTQVDWTPDTTPALWRQYRVTATDGPPDEWVAPTGAHDAYNTGDRVTYPDKENTMGTGVDTIWVWQSKIDANTTEPGQDGDFHRYWEPIEEA